MHLISKFILISLILTGCGTTRGLTLYEDAYSPIGIGDRTTRFLSYPPPKFRMEIIEWENKRSYWSMQLDELDETLLQCEFTGSRTLEVIQVNKGFNITMDSKSKTRASFTVWDNKNIVMQFHCRLFDDKVVLDLTSP